MKVCAECARPVHARGWCQRHYRKWLNSPERKSESPFHRPTFIKFTPALWHKWLEKRQADEQTRVLRAGIQLFRDMLT